MKPTVLQKKLILASKSPRRAQLLEQAGFDFVVKTMDVAEDYPDHYTPYQVASFLAQKKAKAAKDFLKNGNEVIVAADTIVVFENRIFEKPKDKDDAVKMLRQLSNNSHQVITGVGLKTLRGELSFTETSKVWFAKLTDQEIDYYIEKYQPYDKAGSYGIQEWIGLCKISKIEGTYSNIMGLPVDALYIYLSMT